MNNWLTDLYKENTDLKRISIERMHDGMIKVVIMQNDSISNSDDMYSCHYIEPINAKTIDDSMVRISIADLLARCRAHRMEATKKDE